MRISFINNGATIVVVGSGTGPVTSVPTIFKGDKGDPGDPGPQGVPGETYDYVGSSDTITQGTTLGVYDTFTHYLNLNGALYSLLLKPKAELQFDLAAITSLETIETLYDILLIGYPGAKGDKGDPGDAGTGGTITWENVTGKPLTFTPVAHTHLIGDVTGLQTALDGKAASSHTHTYASITGKPSTFAPSAHTHAITDVTGLQAALDGKASTTHTHTYDSITGKPTTFTPAAHTHAISEVTGLQTALDGKASTSHTHTIGNVTGLQTALDGKQPVTTFKTINNEVITGTGNITITGGGSSTPPVLLENTLTNPPISARLGVLDSESSRVFTNAFKQALAWESDANNINWASLVSGGYMTAGGQLISIAPNSNGFRTRLFFNQPAAAGGSGTYRLRWDGTCTIDINGATNVIRDVPNEITFDFTANGSSWVDLIVRTINPAGGQIRNFSLVHEDDIVDFDNGEIFRKQYLDEIRNYRVLRFDEWVGILRGENEGGLRITTWASRPLPTDEIYSYRFVPYEIMAALCNRVGADMWLCLPTAATDDHMQQAATLIQSLMPAPRHVYVEYSTKTWDFSGTPQAHYTAEQGRIAFGTTAAPTQQEFRSWYGMRSTQMALWWRNVWGADARLHTVIQTQADWLGSEDDVLIAPMWQERNGTLGLPAYVAPHTVIDILTVHAQIDGGMAYGGRVTEIDNWRTTLTQTEAFNRMRDQMLTAQYFDDTTDNRNVDNLTIKWNYFKDRAEFYGMGLACYEVGNHLNGVGGSTATRDFIRAFSVSSQMGEVYTATINAVKAIFDGPLCFSVEVRQPDDNIAHGLQRYLGDHNPAWQAVNTLSVLNDGPAGRDTYDFVGTYELVSGDIGNTPITIADVVGLQAALDAKQATTSFKTINGLAITGTGNVVTSISFATDAEAIAYSNANPGVTVGSTQVS